MFFSKLIISLILNIVIFGGLLFLPAGTLRWGRAWVFLGVVFLGTLATMLLVFRDNEDLLKERFKPPIQKGQPKADKIVVSLLIGGFLFLLVLIPLDVFHFHWMKKPGLVASSLGLFLFALGWLIVSLAFHENTFAAPVVKYQEKRQHRVIDTGVYGLVRHPLYSGAAILLIGMPLWLQSYAAALFALVPIGLIVVRISIEEKFLRKNLEGYETYRKKVRYRLFPFFW